MHEYMIGSIKFTAAHDDEAVSMAKKDMFKHGWRNLRLMKKEKDGWGVCKIIPGFENE